MADEIAGVPDRELLERIRAAKNDSTVSVWLLVPLATIPVGAVYGDKAALVAVFASLALCVLLLRLRDRTPRHQAARLAEFEYKRRFRLYDLEAYEAEAMASLDKPGAPDVVMLFAGQGLPHGVHHFVRIDLGDTSRLQVRRAPLLLDAQQREKAETQLFRYGQPLSAAQERKARDVLASLTPENLVPPNHSVFDGFPCKAVVLRRGQEPLWTELNVAGLPAELQKLPAVCFLRLFIELEDEISASRAIAATEAH